MELKEIGRIKTDGEEMFLQINEEYKKCIEGLDGFSNIDILWWFHKCDNDESRNVLQVKKPYTPSVDRIQNPKVPEWCSHWPMSYEKSGDFDWEHEFLF